ncbi:restriction endonuclease subunit S [Desulfobaculum bizertense]|uniref:restriction endonuclease subunit S n=1 Tax=Desulfobaculum bizertense TaxID=376490 RepID=UPI001F231FCF|nr:restriction endonuclease subunit S [Desulfobaculum bizertense]UIJ38948.1 restriction endonuclease subunit S [Desulfobaculum bizertense]
MMQFPRYESYKDSGVEWLGEIPEHWGCDTLRSATLLKSDKNRPDLQVLSVYREYGVIIKDSRDDNHNATSLDTSTYKVVQPGDLVVNKMKAWQGSMGVSEYEGVVSPAYITCKTNQDDFHPKYLHYLLRSKGYIGVYNSISYGVRIGQWDLRYDDFKKVVIPIPLIGEQKRIASFLDKKTAEIDEAIAKKQKLIELLQEQKSILINQAVTKGLNPNAPMKDSGVEWIGEIPAHWAIKKMKWICSSIRDGTHNPPPAVEGEHRLLSVRNIVDGQFVTRDDDRTMTPQAFKLLQRSYTVQAGDVVIALVGGTTGKSAVVSINCDKISVQRSLGILRPFKRQISASCLNYYVKSHFVQNTIWEIAVKYAAQPGIYLDDLAKIRIPVPPLSEQKELVSHLNSVESSYAALMSSVLKEIQFLYEYKSILISSAVTGKIKI